MVFMSLPILLVFLLFVTIFHFTLLKSERWALSDYQWELVDYIWYGVGFLALLIGGFQVLGALERSHLEDELKWIESRYFQIEKSASMASTSFHPKDAGQFQLLNDISHAIRETKFTSGWPIGSVRYKGKIFDSLNLFIHERAKELGVTQLDGLIEAMSTSVLDRVAEARESERKLTQLKPPIWLTVIMPYLIAILIALRIAKVTFKVRQKKRV